MTLFDFIIPAAHAQDAAAPAAGGGAGGLIANILPLVLIFIVFWFLLIRPQQKRMKQHAAKVGAAQRGDTVVTGGGIVGKITKIEDDYVHVELAKGMTVKVVKATLSDVVSPIAKPAND
ncbi:MAG: preprotein translocase subunit YajC [Sphingomonadales bacterium]|nr:preprotein translocase subunit YajC [Sphingomonadales bacterium]